MSISPRTMLLAGVGIIGLTNAIALGGAAYNRSAAPRSTLRLSGREFVVRSGGNAFDVREDSAVSVTLEWAVQTASAEADTPRHYDSGRLGAFLGDRYVPWLDQAKLRSLGIDVPLPVAPVDAPRTGFKHLGREVFVVLELSGATYRAAIGDAQRKSAAAASNSADHPDDQDARRAANSAGESAEQQATRATRLFVVDAGLDAGALGRQYADSTTYAVVRGHVRPRLMWHADKARVTGVVSDLRIGEINVPLEFRAALEPYARQFPSFGSVAGSGLSLDICFGRRHEPWIEAATAGRTPPPTG